MNYVITMKHIQESPQVILAGVENVRLKVAHIIRIRKKRKEWVGGEFEMKIDRNESFEKAEDANNTKFESIK